MKRATYSGIGLAMATMLTVFVMVACSDDHGVETLRAGGATVPVRLHISADLLGDLNATRAAGDTDPGERGEFMHTLCVFVVNNETRMIEAKFCTLEDGESNILTEYSDATDGNLPEWTSEELTLPAGEKTIYAFSNWETVYDEENTDNNKWAKLIALEVGDKMESTDLQFTVDDPASKVDIANGKYIPMSGDTTVVVKDLDGDLNTTVQYFTVGMDRLVGKVMVTVQGETGTDAQNVTVTGISFSGYADKVPLMSDDKETYTYTYDKGYVATDLEQEIAANTSSTTANTTVISFYVNETYRSKATDEGGFGISLTTNRYDGTTYTAATTTTDIPRNHILPLVLVLDNYEFKLDHKAWTSILGVDAEVEYDYPITLADNTYCVTMLDVTTTFTLTPSLTSKNNDSGGSSSPSDLAWTWTYVDEEGEEITEPECTITTGDKGVLTVTTLTATPGYEYAFTLEAAWTEDNNIAHSRLYNVKVVFADDFPSSFVKASRAWWTRPYGSELLRLRTRK